MPSNFVQRGLEGRSFFGKRLPAARIDADRVDSTGQAAKQRPIAASFGDYSTINRTSLGPVAIHPAGACGPSMTVTTLPRCHGARDRGHGGARFSDMLHNDTNLGGVRFFAGRALCPARASAGIGPQRDGSRPRRRKDFTVVGSRHVGGGCVWQTECIRVPASSGLEITRWHTDICLRDAMFGTRPPPVHDVTRERLAEPRCGGLVCRASAASLSCVFTCRVNDYHRSRGFLREYDGPQRSLEAGMAHSAADDPETCGACSHPAETTRRSGDRVMTQIRGQAGDAVARSGVGRGRQTSGSSQVVTDPGEGGIAWLACGRSTTATATSNNMLG
ncbi:hypothetical protein FQR65_LT20658 [Abscondita terminalis]|nr:hypothetical protein FQR65_LT20658 [Abscondita terminalis]